MSSYLIQVCLYSFDEKWAAKNPDSYFGDLSKYTREQKIKANKTMDKKKCLKILGGFIIFSGGSSNGFVFREQTKRIGYRSK